MFDLSIFCGTSEEPRSYLHTPWIERGGVAATDGHVMVFVESPQMVSGDVKDTTPKAMIGKMDKFLDLEFSGNAHPLSGIDIPKLKCPMCEGSRFLVSTICEDCNGEGEFQHGAHWYSCQECEGDGKNHVAADKGSTNSALCPYCSGIGIKKFADSDPYVKIGEVYVAPNILTRVNTLPNAVLYVGDDPGGSVTFRFDGGRGVLMPLDMRRIKK